MMNPFKAPVLTRPRVLLAFAVALAADGIQVALGPLGFGPVDEIIDVAAMVVICLLIGFHPLLLPTFVIEIVPVADMLPTWTGCVGAVIFLRRRAAGPPSPPTPPARPGIKPPRQI